MNADEKNKIKINLINELSNEISNTSNLSKKLYNLLDEKTKKEYEKYLTEDYSILREKLFYNKTNEQLSYENELELINFLLELQVDCLDENLKEKYLTFLSIYDKFQYNFLNNNDDFIDARQSGLDKNILYNKKLSILLKKNEDEKFLDTYQKATQESPMNCELTFLLAEFYLNKNDYENFIISLENVYKTIYNPDDFKRYLELYSDYFKKIGKLNLSFSCYRYSLEFMSSSQNNKEILIDKFLDNIDKNTENFDKNTLKSLNFQKIIDILKENNIKTDISDENFEALQNNFYNLLVNFDYTKKQYDHMSKIVNFICGREIHKKICTSAIFNENVIFNHDYDFEIEVNKKLIRAQNIEEENVIEHFYINEETKDSEYIKLIKLGEITQENSCSKMFNDFEKSTNDSGYVTLDNYVASTKKGLLYNALISQYNLISINTKKIPEKVQRLFFKVSPTLYGYFETKYTNESSYLAQICNDILFSYEYSYNPDSLKYLEINSYLAKIKIAKHLIYVIGNFSIDYLNKNYYISTPQKMNGEIDSYYDDIEKFAQRLARLLINPRQVQDENNFWIAEEQATDFLEAFIVYYFYKKQENETKIITIKDIYNSILNNGILPSNNPEDYDFLREMFKDAYYNKYYNAIQLALNFNIDKTKLIFKIIEKSIEINYPYLNLE